MHCRCAHVVALAVTVALSYLSACRAAGVPGTMSWSFRTGNYVSSSPAIGPDGTVYVGSDDGNLYALAGSSTGGPQPGSPWPMFGGNAQHTGRA
jgi:outer membrane protein assembly factor BamB